MFAWQSVKICDGNETTAIAKLWFTRNNRVIKIKEIK